jgi:hypothetical protein
LLKHKSGIDAISCTIRVKPLDEKRQQRKNQRLGLGVKT